MLLPRHDASYIMKKGTMLLLIDPTLIAPDIRLFETCFVADLLFIIPRERLTNMNM